jgi:MFS transporter, DHA3 family, macrolide efflux protein
MKKFFVIWISQAASLFGSAIVQFALAWHLTQETGSATILATAVLVALLPQIILGPFIGPYIDRWNRKKIIIISDFFIALVTAGLIILFLTDTIQVWHIYIAMVARATGGAFQFPAMAASIPLIVPEKHLARAAGLNQMLNGVINIAAPPAGALLMATLSMHWVLAVDIVTALIAIGCIFLVAIPQPERTTLSVKASAFTDMIQGFRYIWSWKGLTIFMGIITLLHIFTTPAFALLPVFVTENLGGDVMKLGWLSSAFGIGTITGGLIIGVWGGFKRRIITSLMGIFIAGLATIGLGFTTISLFFLGLGATFLMGIGFSICDAPLIAIFQSVIDKDIQGRVFSLIGSVSAAMTPLGLAVAGPVADSIGTRFLLYAAGAAIIFTGIACICIPSIMNLEKHVINGSSHSLKVDTDATF